MGFCVADTPSHIERTPELSFCKILNQINGSVSAYSGHSEVACVQSHVVGRLGFEPRTFGRGVCNALVLVVS